MRTKAQYKDFEPGEFTSEKDRTAEETIELITGFPWQDQRDHLVVSLTNPGITIDGSDNDFLKLAPYYNGKYVLHFLDAHHHLYTRPIDRLEDSLPVIRSFFENQPFDPAGFRKETTLLQNNTQHFVTKDFRYVINRRQILWLVFVMLCSLLFTGILTIGGLKQPTIWLFALPCIVLLVPGVALFINHYKSAHGKVLIVSKGQDAFSYGAADSPGTFYKHDIAGIVTYGHRGRYGYGPLAMVEIDFTNGSRLQLSCLMLNWHDLVAKFPLCDKSTESKWLPFISRDASALFG